MFSYLYLTLCFYILPAFAATLKVRAKKLALSNLNVNTTIVANSTINNSLFFDALVNKLNGVYFVRKSLTDQINNSIHPLVANHASISSSNFSYLFQIKSITFFAINKTLN